MAFLLDNSLAETHEHGSDLSAGSALGRVEQTVLIAANNLGADGPLHSFGSIGADRSSIGVGELSLSGHIVTLERGIAIEHRSELRPGVVPVPAEIDSAVAFKKLETLGIAIDALSDDQKVYLGI